MNITHRGANNSSRLEGQRRIVLPAALEASRVGDAIEVRRDSCGEGGTAWSLGWSEEKGEARYRWQPRRRGRPAALRGGPAAAGSLRHQRIPGCRRHGRRGCLRWVSLPQERQLHVTASPLGFSPASHHPRGAPRLPANQQVRSRRGARLQPGGSAEAHAAPLQHPSASGHLGRPKATWPRLRGQIAPGHLATSGSNRGVTLRAHSALLSPLPSPRPRCRLPPPPRRDTIFAHQGPWESFGRAKVNGGAQTACSARFPRPAAHPPAAGNPPQAPRGPPTLTRSVPQAQLYSLCVDFKTGRVILKHCRNIILDRQNGRKRAKRLCLNARHPLNTLRLPAPQLRKKTLTHQTTH